MARYWTHIINFPLLLASIFTFVLGTGIADYLGYIPNGWVYLLGQGIVLLILISSSILFEYYELLKHGARPFSPWDDGIKADTPSPQTLLTVSVILMTFTVMLSYTLSRFLIGGGLMFLQLALLISLSILFIGQPRLVYSGYGELAQALIVCSLVPTFAFSIQFEGIHQLLLLASFPLVFLFLAIRFALELESYAGDLKAERRTLLIRLGWQRGILFHHVLLITAFLLLSITPLLGMAWRLVWPALLAMPLGLLEIWWINRIALGLPPRWSLLRIIARLTFTLPVYLLALSFWMD